MLLRVDGLPTGGASCAGGCGARERVCLLLLPWPSFLGGSQKEGSARSRGTGAESGGGETRNHESSTLRLLLGAVSGRRPSAGELGVMTRCGGEKGERGACIVGAVPGRSSGVVRLACDAEAVLGRSIRVWGKRGLVVKKPGRGKGLGGAVRGDVGRRLDAERDGGDAGCAGAGDKASARPSPRAFNASERRLSERPCIFTIWCTLRRVSIDTRVQRSANFKK